MGSAQDDAIDAARQRMVDLDRVKEREPGGWNAWQAAAADYWVLRHPELARWRRGPHGDRPSVDEMQTRAALLARAMDDVPREWRLWPFGGPRTEYLAQVGWFHESMAGLYGPVYRVIDQLRAGDGAEIETLVRFLEADVYCHRSGYAKAEANRFLTRVPLDPTVAARLRSVVLDVVDSFDRREFRSYIRLAKHVDDDGLRSELRARSIGPRPDAARRARWMLEGLRP
jgi:hypothetical protein